MNFRWSTTTKKGEENKMFFRGAKSLLLFVCTLGAVAFAPSASAQDVGEFRNAQNIKMRPGIRYTTGAVTTAGWEKSLTDNDPNLRRWNWSAMTSYTQSMYNHVAPGAMVKKKDTAEIAALRPTGSIYVKPIQVSPEVNARRRVMPSPVVVGNSNSNANCIGRVRVPKQQQIATAAPVAKMYNSYAVNGNLLTPGENESLANRNVFGRMVKMQ